MPASRPSKEKRNRANRAKRDALTGRSASARERAPEKAYAAPEPKKSWSQRILGPAPSTKPVRSTGSSSSRSTATKLPAPEGPMPRDARGFPPGGRAATLSLLMALAGCVLLLFIKFPFEKEYTLIRDKVVVDGQVENDCQPLKDSERSKEAKKKDLQVCELKTTYLDEFGPAVLIFMILPAGITGMAVWATRKKDRQAKIYTYCVLGFAIFIFMAQGLGIIFLPPLAALTVASFQSRGAERKLAEAQQIAGGPEPDSD